MPSGNAQMRAWMRRKSKSWSPWRPLMITSFLSDDGILARAMPTAAARMRMESTLPSANGLTILLGITPRIWS